MRLGAQGEGLEIISAGQPIPQPPPAMFNRHLGGLGSLTSGLGSGIGMLSSDAYRQPLQPLPVEQPPAQPASDAGANKRYGHDAWAGGLTSGSRQPDYASGPIAAWGERHAAADPAPRGTVDALQRPVSALLDGGRGGAALGGTAVGGAVGGEHRRGWTAPASGRSQGAGLGQASAAAPAADLNVTPTKHITKQIGALDLVPKALGHYLSAPPPRPAPEPAAAATNSAAAAATGVAAAAAAAGTVLNDGEDAAALYGMHQNIRQALAATPKADAPGFSAMPEVWVCRWVDYSKKYGLGYKLSNGCSGVFFNDATKMLLAPGAAAGRGGATVRVHAVSIRARRVALLLED